MFTLFKIQRKTKSLIYKLQKFYNKYWFYPSYETSSLLLIFSILCLLSLTLFNSIVLFRIYNFNFFCISNDIMSNNISKFNWLLIIILIFIFYFYSFPKQWQQKNVKSYQKLQQSYCGKYLFTDSMFYFDIILLQQFKQFIKSIVSLLNLTQNTGTNWFFIYRYFY